MEINWLVVIVMGLIVNLAMLWQTFLLRLLYKRNGYCVVCKRHETRKMWADRRQTK